MCLVVVESNSETKVGVQVLRDTTSHSNSFLFDNVISGISTTMTNITDLVDIHKNLMKGTFEVFIALLLMQCFSLNFFYRDAHNSSLVKTLPVRKDYV